MYLFSLNDDGCSFQRSTNLEVYGNPNSPHSPEEIACQPHLDLNTFYDKAIAGDFSIIQYTRSLLNKGLQQKGKFRFGDDESKLSRAEEAEVHPLMEKLDDEFRRITTTCIENGNEVFHRLIGECFRCPIPAHLPAICRPEIIETSSAIGNKLQQFFPQVSLSEGAANSGHMWAADIQPQQDKYDSFTEENHSGSASSIDLMDNQVDFSTEINFGSQECINKPNPGNNAGNNARKNSRSSEHKDAETSRFKSPRSP